MKAFDKELSIEIPQSLSQVIAGYLEKQIIEDRLEAGDRLIPDELAQRFNVSKSPVREALLSLEKEGLVVNVPRTGFFVADISLEDIEEIYPIRASLNALMIRIIIEKGYNSDFILTFEELLAEMEQKVEVNDIDEFFYLNVKLWDFILMSCPNERLKAMLEQLGKQVLRFRHLSMSIPGRIESSCAWHKKLLKAIKDKDIESASRVAEDLIYEALETLREILRKETPVVN